MRRQHFTRSRAVPLAALAMLALLLGCGPGKLADAMAALADRACACSDDRCAVEVNASIASLLRRAREATKAEAESMMVSLARAGSCSRHLAAPAPAGAPTPEEPEDSP
jgi:hypothetical protein